MAGKDVPPEAQAQRKLWVRALLMLLMAAAFQLSAWVLFFVAILQLIIRAAAGHPNPRLQSAGFSIGRYLSQIAQFLSFQTEALPFPFADWPSDERP